MEVIRIAGGQIAETTARAQACFPALGLSLALPAGVR